MLLYLQPVKVQQSICKLPWVGKGHQVLVCLSLRRIQPKAQTDAVQHCHAACPTPCLTRQQRASACRHYDDQTQLVSLPADARFGQLTLLSKLPWARQAPT